MQDTVEMTRASQAHETGVRPGVAAASLRDPSIGRIVSVTGSKAIVLLDNVSSGHQVSLTNRPEMGTLLAIRQQNTVVLAIVSALSVPVPSQGDGDAEIWIAELGLVGELQMSDDGQTGKFNRGVTIYPSLGDRVRVAGTKELEWAFCGDMKGKVRVGGIRQDSNIPAMVSVNDLLGKHFAILGTTGTGKSCTTALVLRSILEQNPAAHIVLLDPHNEYASAFKEWAEVVNPRNMQLPYWLLTFEEFIEVLIGDPTGRKQEIEILQELIPLCKARYSNGRSQESKTLRRGGPDTTRYTVDTPVPYRISDLMAFIDDRMGKLENKNDLQPYRQIRQRVEMISQDSRYSFMFGQLTVYDGMAQILGRIFRVPVNDKPITILELTGLPTEIVNVVVSVLCRMTFDFALWSEGQVPVTLVCEEAHRYVPADPDAGFEPCKRAIAKIAKEGRKYGASLCIVTQRPAEIDPTILSQCNTVFALRMSNDRDQQIVRSAVSDTGSGLLEFLPALGQREAIAFGDGVALPVRIRFDELAPHNLPRSSTAQFSEKWQKSVGDVDFLQQVVERWRSTGMSEEDETDGQTSMLAEAMGIKNDAPQPASATTTASGGRACEPGAGAARRTPSAGPAQRPRREGEPQERRPGTMAAAQGAVRQHATATAGAGEPALRRQSAAAEAAPATAPASASSSSALQSLRSRIMKRDR
jgi:DNA helicase HerA-like ATPase